MSVPASTLKESGGSLEAQLQPIPRTEGHGLASAKRTARALADRMLKFPEVLSHVQTFLNIIFMGIYLVWFVTGDLPQGSGCAFIVIGSVLTLISLYQLKLLRSGEPEMWLHAQGLTLPGIMKLEELTGREMEAEARVAEYERRFAEITGKTLKTVEDSLERDGKWVRWKMPIAAENGTSEKSTV